MKAYAIKPNIYWVGAIDWDVRNFHGYLTQRGTTYNAYLVKDTKVALIDTVKPGYLNELLQRLEGLVELNQIDYLISNHVEMDHSGEIPALLKLCPNMTIITSAQGAKGLKAHYGNDLPCKEVCAGDTLSLGNKTLHFTPIPMVHWPDSMVTYMVEDRVLFPNDAFGQHIAIDHIFADEIGLDIVMEQAAKYYANIVLPYGSQTQKALKALSTLDVEVIAPSHGAVFRYDLGILFKKYHQWSLYQSNPNKALIVYDSMWGSTEKMAKTIKYALDDKGISSKKLSLSSVHVSDVMTDLLEAHYVFIGSPTLNTSMMPSMGAFITYLRGLRPKNKHGFVFGSYGWGEKACKEIHAELSNLGWTLNEPFTQKYIPSNDDLHRLTQSVNEFLANGSR